MVSCDVYDGLRLRTSRGVGWANSDNLTISCPFTQPKRDAIALC
ncbi:MAG: hypothetical protein V7K90_24760 [Nostoc sp.]